MRKTIQFSNYGKIAEKAERITLYQLKKLKPRYKPTLKSKLDNNENFKSTENNKIFEELQNTIKLNNNLEKRHLFKVKQTAFLQKTRQKKQIKERKITAAVERNVSIE